MPIRNIAIGRPEEATHPNTLKAALAEFISTFIFVFAGSGSGIAYNNLTSDGAATPAGLISSSIAHAFGLVGAVSVGANISGGHVNPAVTFGAFIGGNIIAQLLRGIVYIIALLLRGIVYIIAQLLGSIVASLLLVFVTGFSFVTVHRRALSNALVMEIVMTFGLVYTVYPTAVDPKKGNLGIIPPIATGFIAGANILAGGPFTGASMNPAVSFGTAVVSWSWDKHWIYWLGPLLGGGLSGLIYEVISISHTHEQLPTADY